MNINCTICFLSWSTGGKQLHSNVINRKSSFALCINKLHKSLWVLNGKPSVNARKAVASRTYEIYTIITKNKINGILFVYYFTDTCFSRKIFNTRNETGRHHRRFRDRISGKLGLHYLRQIRVLLFQVNYNFPTGEFNYKWSLYLIVN